LTESGLAAAANAFREGSRSFAGAARLFDPRVRRSATLLYAWCRYCDDLVDGQGLGLGAPRLAAGQSVLDDMLAQTRAALLGRPRAGTPYEGLAEVVARHAIPPRYPMDLVAGFAMDVRGTRYDTLADTLTYCYHVAGTVGVMMALVMGVRDEETLDLACDLGIAFQLTNIARDVGDDAEAGRVYLPRDWLLADDVDPAGLADPAGRRGVERTVARLLDEADLYYASARVGITRLPLRSALAVGAAWEIYRAIGVAVRRRGCAAWDRRAATSGRDKLRLAAAGVLRALVGRFMVIEPAIRRGSLWSRASLPNGSPVMIKRQRPDRRFGTLETREIRNG
jgi:phytoene synthase